MTPSRGSSQPRDQTLMSTALAGVENKRTLKALEKWREETQLLFFKPTVSEWQN